MGLVLVCDSSDSSDVNPQDIYQSYQYEYNVQTNKTKVRVAFQIGSSTGDYLELSEPASIKVNGVDFVNYVNIGLCHYHFRFDGQQEVAIEFKDNDGSVYVNNIHKEVIDPIELAPDIKYDEGTDWIINFLGDPLKKDENMHVVLYNDFGVSSSHYQYNEGASNVTVQSGYLNDFKGSEVSLYVVREKSEEIKTASSAGGRISALYRSKEIKVRM
ncbi:MAG: hypothetical protein JEZ14_22985 [Marinilabiliaceae bacterium]|nr:hypothetical protein [Marinilabiliaceae bacterium]